MSCDGVVVLLAPPCEWTLRISGDVDRHAPNAHDFADELHSLFVVFSWDGEDNLVVDGKEHVISKSGQIHAHDSILEELSGVTLK